MVPGIERRIYLIRGRRVMLDSDLARVYKVPTKRLNEQVRRNAARFPADFMFRLSPDEAAGIRSQNATLKTGRGKHRKYHPRAFTEHGAIMLASLLHCRSAVIASVMVVRAFVRLRELLAARRGLSRRVADLEEGILRQHGRIETLFEAIQRLSREPESERRRIGFRPPPER